VNVGYLCAGLAVDNSIRLQRWKDFEGTVVVHVPLPDIPDAVIAREMQLAAAAGLRAWTGQPFPILAEVMGDREPHFSVRWTASLGGALLGAARTLWSPEAGLSVVEIEMATRDPFDPGAFNQPQRVRITAAHEMGHALGLGHSDRPGDVMYPTNTATSMSASDYRSIEVLYANPDGLVVIR
jgi:hypothetical protein